MTDSAFGDLDDEFAGQTAAPAGGGALYPEATYKYVIVPFDPKGNGQMVDFEIFKANTGTHGLKMMCETLEPEVVKDEKTGEDVTMKGVIVEKVFWVTGKSAKGEGTLAFVKRDLGTIIGKEIPEGIKLSDVVQKTTWAGRTFEGVYRHRRDNKDVLRGEISFINPWNPDEPAAETKKAEKSPPAKGAAADKKAKQTAF